jgi:hypothetical protein
MGLFLVEVWIVHVVLTVTEVLQKIQPEVTRKILMPVVLLSSAA